MSRAWILSALCVTSFAWASFAATACETTVRDSAFQAPRDSHRLVLMARGGDPEAAKIAERLSQWLAGPASELNVELVQLDVDDPDVQWQDYGVPSAPPTTPVVALVGRDHVGGVNFVIDHWEPAPDADDLAALLSSPIRESIGSQLSKSLAVVLFAPALDSDSGSAHAAVGEFVNRRNEKEGRGVTLVRVDRSDDAERTLLSFVGIDPSGADWAGVVFGRGKLMAPPLIGAEITAEALAELVEQLEADCSCSKPLHTLGVDLPMAWPAAYDANALAHLEPVDEAENLLAAIGATKNSPPTAVLADAVDSTESAKATDGSLRRSMGTVAICVGGVALLLVVVVSVAMLRSKER